MRSVLWGIAAVAAAAGTPETAHAELLRCLFGHACKSCVAPPVCVCPVQCVCPVPPPCPAYRACTTWQPVVETRYRAEPAVSWRDVKRVGYRVVPFEYTQRVAQVTTRLVPESTVRYVPQRSLVPLGTPAWTPPPPLPPLPPPPAPAAPAGHGTGPLAGGTGGSGWGAAHGAALPYGADVPLAGSDLAPIPEVTNEAQRGPWLTVPQRGTEVQPTSRPRMRYDVDPHRESVRAPSAAKVWQTPR